MRTKRLICGLAMLVGVVLSGREAGAQAIDVRQACTPDAMRLCSEFIPDADKVKHCMMAKRGQLSPECVTAIRDSHGGGRARVRRVDYHHHHDYEHHGHAHCRHRHCR